MARAWVAHRAGPPEGNSASLGEGAGSAALAAHELYVLP
jgi:hypothetical protein